MKDYRFILGAILILIGLLGHRAPEYLQKFKSAIFKDSIQVVDEKPADTTIEKSKKLAELVTDKEDRLNLALFNLEFSKRLQSYFEKNITSQQLIDLYTESLKNNFKDSLSGKYTGLSEEIQKLFESSIGPLDHILSKPEIESLKNDLVGLAWNLSNS